MRRLFIALLLAVLPLPGAVRVTLLQTTDLHHHARDAGQEPGLGGYPRIAAYVESVRAGCGHPVLLVDSGDWSMGTPYDLTLGRAPLALRFADALRYDCLTLGNHEFDGGPAGLAAILRAAGSAGLRTPIVASNLEAGADPGLAPFLGPGRTIRGTLVEDLANGVRVGFIGLMGRAAAGEALAAPVRFTDYGRDYAAVQGLVDRLRAGQGCRLVVALDHAGTDASGTGGEDVELARHVTGIDVIASGHTHNPLDAARTVANGRWRTRILCAGAYGAHVSRLDLAFPPGGGPPRLEASSNPAMDGARDPGWAAALVRTDLDLNRDLAPVFTRTVRFVDSTPGLCHPVGGCGPDLPGGGQPLPAPGGLGDLCADAMRAVANGLLGPGCADPTPFTAAVVAGGELRGGLRGGADFSFADVYSLLPLGRSPDPGQTGWAGSPLVSAYVEGAGLRAMCAVQLMAQAGVAGPDDYLNLSGLAYDLKPSGTAAFFAAARAATALDLIRRRAGEGSAPAKRTLAALARLPADRGAALRRAAAAGNPYARALVPGPLDLLAQVSAAGTDGAARLLVARALAAVGPMRVFAPDDPACTGPAVALGPGRRRIVLDMYLLAMVQQTQGRFGLDVHFYRAARGGDRLAGLPALLAGRLNLDPGGPMREVKAWMAPLLYLRGGHFRAGRITGEYASAGPFPASGAAVRMRNAAYPLEAVDALAALARALREAS